MNIFKNLGDFLYNVFILAIVLVVYIFMGIIEVIRNLDVIIYTIKDKIEKFIKWIDSI